MPIRQDSYPKSLNATTLEPYKSCTSPAKGSRLLLFYGFAGALWAF